MRTWTIAGIVTVGLVCCVGFVQVRPLRWHTRGFEYKEPLYTGTGGSYSGTIKSFDRLNQAMNRSMEAAEADGFEPFNTTETYLPQPKAQADQGWYAICKTTIWLRKQN